MVGGGRPFLPDILGQTETSANYEPAMRQVVSGHAKTLQRGSLHTANVHWIG